MMPSRWHAELAAIGHPHLRAGLAEAAARIESYAPEYAYGEAGQIVRDVADLPRLLSPNDGIRIFFHSGHVGRRDMPDVLRALALAYEMQAFAAQRRADDVRRSVDCARRAA